MQCDYKSSLLQSGMHHTAYDVQWVKIIAAAQFHLHSVLDGFLINSW